MLLCVIKAGNRDCRELGDDDQAGSNNSGSIAGFPSTFSELGFIRNGANVNSTGRFWSIMALG